MQLMINIFEKYYFRIYTYDVIQEEDIQRRTKECKCSIVLYYNIKCNIIYFITNKASS